MPRSSRREQGQATLEYVAVVALVAAVVCVGGLAVAPGVANAVVRGLQRALCLVSGSECMATEARPCVVARDATDESVTVNAVLIRVGHRAGILREELSDGTVDVTQIDDLSAGVDVGLGAKGRVALGGVDVAAGGGVSAAVGGWLGHTRTFHTRDGRAADELIRRLTRGSRGTIAFDLPVRLVKGLLGLDRDDRVPRADEVTFAGGAEASLELPGVAGVGLDGTLRGGLGGSWDRVTGRRTYFLQLDAEAQQALRQTLGLQGEARVVLGLTVDRRGNPLQLGVTGITAADGGVALPPGLPRDTGAGGPSGRLELEATLDLTQAENAAAARRLVGAVRRAAPAAAARAAGALARRLARDGTIDVRVYSTRSSSRGVGGEVAIGAKGGLDVSLDHSLARLRVAYTRPAGGAWEKRVDCVQA